MVTAACCIIGDEILSGKTKDTNSHYLAKKLFDLGIELQNIQVVGDNAQDIQQSVRYLSSRYDLVFTSGGIGPTHDDITYESIAGAFNLSMKLDNTTYDYIQEQMKAVNKYHARMATFPYPAQLLRSGNLKIPVVVVNMNVYILPGVPRLFKLLLDSLVERDQIRSGVRFYREEIATKRAEVEIADVLAQIQRDHGDVKIGSYPVWDLKKVVVSVSGTDETRVSQVAREVLKRIDGWIEKSHI